ncbi:NAD(P)H-hydrate epimerase [Corynebacterium mendelii]|uniref:Bifunctional NAD(P)H-hydrate repair enzyme n=1 Tax=Corynebacterium mendelii TaxID=2765362 RepID=A0A939IX26_9CORY|nr:NAD(P)H-hydrate epimerase [Corynebacterium mendelii]MBN9644045.1 NAD(P)H-hydrate epimerase [Corynebacterium mendelii]
MCPYPVHTPQAVRTAELPLVARMGETLMRHAAFAVACSCVRVLKHTRINGPSGARVLVLAGSGGNGGDALYAAAELKKRGAQITVWTTSPSVHQPALDALGHVRRKGSGCEAPFDVADAAAADLIIDGIVGIGATGGLRGPAAVAAAVVAGHKQCPVVAVDIPSGVDPMTGHKHSDAVVADVTVTFGARKPAHVLGGGYCGEVVCVGLGIDQQLSHVPPWARVVTSSDLVDWPVPGRLSNKYTGGVTGVHAGSAAYPGAAVLAVTGAVRATSPMVRYAGECRDRVLATHPEVVTSPTVDSAGQVDCWVTGPGAGVGDDQLEWLIDRDTPLVIDADALTQLAGDEQLRHRCAARQHLTVLTPHDGEYARLVGRKPGRDRIGAARKLAEQLGCCVLLKGRVTVVATAAEAFLVDAECSWAATPGSGDVLAGMIGAAIAHRAEPMSVALAAKLHAQASKSLRGPAPAGDLARAVTAVLREVAADNR